MLQRLPASGLAGGLIEFLVFGLKQGWACLFGGVLLALMLVTAWVWPANSGLARYDALFLAALGWLGAFAGGAAPARPVARVIFWGALAMAITAGIGRLVGTAV